MKQSRKTVKTRIAVYKVKTKRKDIKTVKTTIAKHKVKTETKKLKNEITKRKDLKSEKFPAQNYLTFIPFALAVAFIPPFIFLICYFSFQLPFHSIFRHLIPFQLSLQKSQLLFKTSTANEATTQHSELAIFTQPLFSITLYQRKSWNLLVPFSVNYTKKRSIRNFWKPPFMESRYSHLRQLRHIFHHHVWIQFIGFQMSHLPV
jgi:hypothetical protein